MTPPNGYVGSTATAATLQAHTTVAGTCEGQATLEHGAWPRYRSGS